MIHTTRTFTAALAALVGVVAACSSGDGGAGTGGESPGGSSSSGSTSSGSTTSSSSSSTAAASSSSSSGKTGTFYYCMQAGGYICTGVSNVSMSTAVAGCTAGGGTPVDACPSANLLGCCTTVICPSCGTGQESENCDYAGGGNTEAGWMQACMQTGGTWSSTP